MLIVLYAVLHKLFYVTKSKTLFCVCELSVRMFVPTFCNKSGFVGVITRALLNSNYASGGICLVQQA